jgi:uncharacterized membrane protein HdeD (DUF308 family)
MSYTSVSREQTRELTGLWWLPLSLGVLSAIAGVIVLAKPSDSLATLAVVAGIFVLVDGIAELCGSLMGSTENRGLVALLGVLNLIVGVVLIRHPVGGVTFVAVILGVWLIAIGAVRFVQSFETEGHRVWRLVVAVVEVIAGIVIISSPHIGFATLALLIGFAFIVNGVSLFVLGIAMHTLKRDTVEPPRQPGAAGT